MPVPRSTLRAHIVVAIKRLPKADRAALSNRDWQTREAAERVLADAIMDALGAFEIDLKSTPVAPAPSVRE